MQKKLLAVAVAGALVAPAAFAQTSVTISGALNLWWESAAAEGATAGSAADVKSRDRIADGAGSNIRFSVVEDLGGGMQAFGQVESAVFNNADTRGNALGTSASPVGTTIASAGGWASRNSGVGLRSSAWGEFLMGIWDVHYQEVYAVDSHILKGASNSNTLGLLNTFGVAGGPTIGARYSNVMRYQSPSWSGFNIRAAYVRPTDTAPLNAPGNIADGKKNRAWNFVPNYSNGPIYLAWSHLDDKDMVTTAAVGGGTVGIAAGSVLKVTSDRFFASYAFPMGFKIGFVYDRSKLHADTVAGNGDLKRDVWAIPLSYTTGPHSIFFDYAKAKSWKGSAVDGAAPVVINGNNYSLTGDSGARMISLGYEYELSKRTNVHLTYAQIRNDALAQYDFFSAPVGGTAAGADPRVYSIGLRHAF